MNDQQPDVLVDEAQQPLIAPEITPDEFIKMFTGERGGSIQLDPLGRVRSTAIQTVQDDAGLSLRKRRAWY